MMYGVDALKRLVGCESFYREIVRVERGLVRLEIGRCLRSWMVNWLVWGRARYDE